MPQFKTLEEAQKAHDTLEIAHANLTEHVETVEAEKNRVIRESMGRKTLIKELTEKNEKILSTMTEAGLEFEDGDEFSADTIKGAIEKTKAAATKGTKPDSEFDKVQKRMADLEKKLSDAETAREQQTLAVKMEKARNAFLGKINDQFTDPEIVVDHAMSKNLISLDDDGNPVIKQGDEFVPLAAEKGITAIDVLKKLYPKQAITQQKGGGKDTKVGGRGSRTGEPSIKEVTLDEFNALDHTAKAALVAEAKEGKAKIG